MNSALKDFNSRRRVGVLAQLELFRQKAAVQQFAVFRPLTKYKVIIIPYHCHLTHRKIGERHPFTWLEHSPPVDLTNLAGIVARRRGLICLRRRS